MIGHLGPRVSALLDGQLPAEEAERAWAHVHACHACRDLVEREGWVKTRLAGLSFGTATAPDHLKGRLGAAAFTASSFPSAPAAGAGRTSGARRPLGLVALGGGAVGMAVAGVLALGTAPADGPGERRAPTTSLTRPEVPPMRTPVPATQLHREPRR